MKLHTARNTLSIVWIGGVILFFILLFSQTPGMATDAGKVWESAPLFIAPMLAQAMTFLFGPVKKDKESMVTNPTAFWVALAFSVLHLAAVFVGLFVWEGSMLDNITKLGAPLGYLSALTVGAVSFFFVGVSRPPGQQPPGPDPG